MRHFTQRAIRVLPLLLIFLMSTPLPASAALSQIILTENIFFTAEEGFYTESIQSVLQNLNSPLTTYAETLSDQAAPASEIIWLASQTKDFGVNPKVLLVSLKVMGWLDQQPSELLTPFVQNMTQTLWDGYVKYLEGSRSVTLSNGTQVTLSSVNSATYALAFLLAPGNETETGLAEQMDAWKAVYQQLFSVDPSIEKQAPDPHAVTGIEPFLQLPFTQSESSNIAVNSFFDHAVPSVFDDSILRFDGKTVTGASFSTCALGVSCYGGHNGIDYKTGAGMPIYAAAGGTVVYKYYNTDETAGTVDSGLYIDHANGYRTAYWHMDPIVVEYGQTLKAGDLVGYSGNIGKSSGAHLHFGLRLVSANKAVDPFGWWSTTVNDTWGGSEWMWAGDNIADIGEAQTQLFYRSYWYPVETGYGGSSFWTYEMSTSANSTNWAIWGTYIKTAGQYRVYAYWPSDSTNTTNAKYKIFYSGGAATVAVDQSASGDKFVLLGTYNFGVGSAAVMMNDYTGGSGGKVRFDAIKWEPVSTATSTPTTKPPTITSTVTKTPVPPTSTPTQTSSPTSVTQGLTNIALGMPATQSSVFKNRTNLGLPSMAVDGNIDGNYFNQSVAHTEYETKPWWQVDLGSVQDISKISVWNRTDCCSARLTGFYVFVSDVPFTSTSMATTKAQTGVSAFYFSGQAGTPSHIDINRTGRYVRVQLNSTNYLTIAEVEVWSGDTPSTEQTSTPVTSTPASSNTPTPTATATNTPTSTPTSTATQAYTPTPTSTPDALGLTNIALGMPATQSSVFMDRTNLGLPSMAVDGKTDGNYFNQSVTHTKYDTKPWWQVDLGAIQNINKISIWNRTDCCSTRLTGFYVFVSDVPFSSTNLATTKAQTGVSSFYFSGKAGRPSDITINRSGRYVRVQLNSTNYLSLAEVQVWSDGSEVADSPILATPDPSSYYKIQSGSPYYIPNFAHPDAGNNWMGIGGQVFNENGVPVNQIVVVVKGTLNGVTINKSTQTGASTDYGAGGYEIVLGNAPLASTDKLTITLYSLSGVQISNSVTIDTYADKLKNLVIINFVKQ